MENQDKIVEQFKRVIGQTPPTEFPAMENVWDRVAEKLDKKVLKKENKLWKKIAIAASFLLIATLGYQLVISDQESKNEGIQTVAADSVKQIYPQITPPKNQVVQSNQRHPEIKKEAAIILNDQIDSPVTITVIAAPIAPAAESVAQEAFASEPIQKVEADEEKNSGTFQNRSFDAIGVKRKKEFYESEKSQEKSAKQKSESLMVIDGKAVTKKDYDRSVKELSNLDADEIEDIVVLKEPLYIINGIHFSEEDIFGSNPTSPYAPLSQQEIETLTILQGKEAISKYGEKGSKGVVIIFTKDRKPFNPPSGNRK